ncbi:hypothetical protein ACQY0O_001808 [Thecaphora frezii]
MSTKADTFTGDLSLRYFVESRLQSPEDSPSASAAARKTPQGSRMLTCRKATVPASPSLAIPAPADTSLSMLMDTSLGDVSKVLPKSPAKPTRSAQRPSSAKKRQSLPLVASPLKNFYFTTDLRKISEVPANEDEQLLDQLDTSQLERLAWETMELEQKAKRSTAVPTASSTSSTTIMSTSGKGATDSTRQSRSKQPKLSMLEESSLEAESIAPFVQLTRGRSSSRSPRKTRRASLLPTAAPFHLYGKGDENQEPTGTAPEAERAAAPTKRSCSPSRAPAMGEKRQKRAADEAVPVAAAPPKKVLCEIKNAANGAGSKVQSPVKANRKPLQRKSSVSKGDRPALSGPASVVSTVSARPKAASAPSPTPAPVSGAKAAPAKTPTPEPGPKSNTSSTTPGSSSATAIAAVAQTRRAVRAAEKAPASLAKRPEPKPTSRPSGVEPTKLPTKKGSRVSLAASQETREERRKRLGLVPTLKEEPAMATSEEDRTAAAALDSTSAAVAPSDASAMPTERPHPPSKSPTAQQPALGSTESSLSIASPSPSTSPTPASPRRPSDRGNEEEEADMEVQPKPAAADPADAREDSDVAKTETSNRTAPFDPSNTNARTERRRSARLSLKATGSDSSPRDTATPATAKAKPSARKSMRPSLTVPTIAQSRKEAAVQRSAVTQLRKSIATRLSCSNITTTTTTTTTATTKAAAQSRKSAAATDAQASAPAPAAPKSAAAAATGRVLRNRQSLVAPPAPVPVTVIGGKFRQTATGELVPISSLEAAAFRLSTDARGAQHAAAVKIRLEKQEQERKQKATYKANPIPEWMRKRKEELEKAEEERLQAQLEEARQLELNKQKKKRVATSSLVASASPKKQRTVAKPFVSSVEARLAERQRWEEKRKRKEALIEAEREKARRVREQREEEEYREARKRSVIKANPLPDYLHYAVTTSTSTGAGSKASSTGRSRPSG